MRRWMTLSVTAALLLSISVPANAGRPIEEEFSLTSFDCSLSGDDTEGFLFVFSEGDFGAFVDAALWLEGADPSLDPPTLISDPETSSVTIDGSNVSAGIAMVDFETFEPAGTMTVAGTIGDLIDEFTFSDRFRDGNRWVEITETTQIFEASADVSFDSTALEATCSSSTTQGTFQSTNPHAFVFDFEEAFVECFGIPGSDGSTLSLFAGEFENEAFLSMQIFSTSDVPDLVGDTPIDGLVGTTDVTVPLFDPFDGESPVTEANVSMLVELGEVTESRIVGQDVRIKEVRTELLVLGSVVVVDGATYELEGCFGAQFDVHGVFNEASGPKESGPTPANDLPSGAIDLDPWARLNQQTKGAVLEPEEPCDIAPLGKTVWFAVEGTGSPITIDTAGSGFDTVVGIYDPDTFTEITCVDDVFEAGFSLQSRVTWDTEPGETYLIQVGGFAGEYGLLKLSLSDQ